MLIVIIPSSRGSAGRRPADSRHLPSVARWSSLVGIVLGWTLLAGESAAQSVDFDRDIRPLLSDRCFICHGPDAESRRAGLRLDLREDAVRDRGGYAVIVPGAAAESEFMARIRHPEADEVMPPPSSRLSLNDGEVKLFARWIDEGAVFDRHWAFVSPAKNNDVPKVDGDNWSKDDFDRFVLRRLKSDGMAPTKAASPERWLRRVTFDLTGLPPTPKEVDDFIAVLAKPWVDAEVVRGNVVDRLLASPRFGERMATTWIDVARYADSYGYQSDRLSPTWPWRDWVVRAFNDNLPYDDFIRHQLAGDLIPDATRETRLATAFNRLHRMTNEGGSVPEEWRVESVADRVHTFGAAMLGLTTECARCHDHKYDPLTQRDYYRLFAYFDDIDEWGLYHDSSRVPTPSLLLPTEKQERAAKRLEAEIAAAEREERRVETDHEESFRGWLAEVGGEPRIPGRVGHYAFEEVGPKGEITNLENPKLAATTSLANRLVDGPTGKRLRLVGDEAATFPKVAGRLGATTSFSVAFHLQVDAAHANGLIFHRSGGTDVGFHGTEVTLEDGRLRFAMIRYWPGNAIAVRSTGAMTPGRNYHVVFTYDASISARGMAIYLDGEPVTEVLRDGLTKEPGQGGSGLVFGSRFRTPALPCVVDELQVWSRTLTSIEVAQIYDGRSLRQAVVERDEIHRLRPYYFANFSPPVTAARAKTIVLRRELLDLRTRMLEVPVMSAMATPRPTYLLRRGDYDSPAVDDGVLTPAPPHFLPALAQGNARDHADRLDLARWLTHPDHPLTARVAVNRLWQTVFGTGLVATSDDFGVQGNRPTHPDLLDYLARSFIASGWDVKSMLRRITMSATYRQDSTVSAAQRRRDPDNMSLARGPSRGLAAEMIRDTALFAAGLLNETRGGPPVSPYQPPGLWREANTMSPAYRQSVGTALYRRSLYTVWKRTTPIPNMLVLDAPTREVCVAKRQRTNSPLQALVLLNDVQFVEAARVAAESVLKSNAITNATKNAAQRVDDSVERAVVEAFRRFARRPTDEEVAVLHDFFRREQEHFRVDSEAAARLAGAGDHPRDEALDPVDVAAMTVVVQTIMNMDATIRSR